MNSNSYSSCSYGECDIDDIQNNLTHHGTNPQEIQDTGGLMSPTPLQSRQRTNQSSSKIKSLATTLRLISLLILYQTRPSDGGTCWTNVEKNGKCSNMVQMRTTREECCGNGFTATSASAAYSEVDLRDGGFLIMHIRGGEQCTRCKDTCENVICPENKKCSVRDGHPECVCSPNCTAFKRQNGMQDLRGPVCGTDRQTYKNVCRLLKRSCRRKLLISVAYPGPCEESCFNVTCPGTKKCLVDQNLIPHCVNCSERKCHTKSSVGGSLISTPRSICGTDGLTYPSVCHIRQAACHRGKAIPIAYTGPCKKSATCDSIHCSAGQSCLTEKHTGKPRCVTCSRKRWCRKYQRHKLADKGPICSTNGNTYRNWCEMMDDACSTGTALDTKYLGQCKARDRFFVNTNRLD